jgi:hypothetical protein
MKTNVRTVFRFPIRWLNYYHPRFKAAISDDIVGSPVTDKLPPTFPTDFDAQAEIVAKSGIDRRQALAAGNQLTTTGAEARQDVLFLASRLRLTARAALLGEDPLLRSAFFVADQAPKDLPTVINRVQQMLVSCVNHDEALAGEGWTAADTKALGDALTALTEAAYGRAAKSDEKIGCTATMIVQANRYYRMCRTIQRVAASVFSLRAAQKDPSLYAARAKYMLGEFPPDKYSDDPEEPAAPPADGGSTSSGGTTAPTPPPGGTAAGS